MLGAGLLGCAGVRLLLVVLWLVMTMIAFIHRSSCRILQCYDVDVIFGHRINVTMSSRSSSVSFSKLIGYFITQYNKMSVIFMNYTRHTELLRCCSTV